MSISPEAWPVAVCSWSLRTDPDGVTRALRELGIEHVNLALKPAFLPEGEQYVEAVRKQSWKISACTIGFSQEDYSSLESIRISGGIVPDEHWPRNREIVLRSLALTAEFQVPFLTMHAGFLEEEKTARSLEIQDRLIELGDAAGKYGIMLLLETGQETAECLRSLLQELAHPALGVNFDPANMILYGKGNPVDAAGLLGPWIRHIHAKDALAARIPGGWGTEVPWGQGEVGGAVFLDALQATGYSGALAIERETGDNRLGDVRLAADSLRAWVQTNRKAAE